MSEKEMNKRVCDKGRSEVLTKELYWGDSHIFEHFTKHSKEVAELQMN